MHNYTSCLVNMSIINKRKYLLQIWQGYRAVQCACLQVYELYATGDKTFPTPFLLLCSATYNTIIIKFKVVYFRTPIHTFNQFSSITCSFSSITDLKWLFCLWRIVPLSSAVKLSSWQGAKRYKQVLR